jgi:predicted transcriptional regulator|tara:strand:- start:2734 stop:3060 length:327 start_codon:yes stop_codon:yes gene_type:complete
MSKKTGKLTKVEKFYIDNNSDKTVEEIASDLNRTANAVKKHIEKTTGHVDSAQNEKADISDLFGHKEGRGVTVMTQAASEVADDSRKGRVNISKKHQQAIHIINPDKK